LVCSIYSADPHRNFLHALAVRFRNWHKLWKASCALETDFIKLHARIEDGATKLSQAEFDELQLALHSLPELSSERGPVIKKFRSLFRYWTIAQRRDQHIDSRFPIPLLDIGPSFVLSIYVIECQ
jgi:hypothetical protein